MDQPKSGRAAAADCHSRHRHIDHHSHHAGSGGTWRLAAHATLHCLTGCVIGETIGLAIGAELQLGTAAIVTLATALSYLSGFLLGLVPLMRERGISLLSALRIIWIGEVISIAAMEVAMNMSDYAMGSMGAKTMFSWLWLRGLLVAVPMGFIAAWPVNQWLLKRGLKRCH
jgi:uncharacterized membrane protein